MLTKFKKITKYVDSLLFFNFYLIYHAKKYCTKQICIKILRLFVLIKIYEISVIIRKYIYLFFRYPFFRISIFYETKQIEKLDIRDIRSKSQIPSKIWISDPCPSLDKTTILKCYPMLTKEKTVFTQNRYKPLPK